MYKFILTIVTCVVFADVTTGILIIPTGCLCYVYSYIVLICLLPHALLWHDFILVNIDQNQMNCAWLVAGKINWHGGKYNCIETPVTNWRLTKLLNFYSVLLWQQLVHITNNLAYSHFAHFSIIYRTTLNPNNVLPIITI